MGLASELLSKDELLSARIRMGEIELIFDTSALRGISQEELRAFSVNKIRMIASPYCAFEGIRHLDDENDFEKYRSLMKKIDEIGVAHLPTYESSEELGLANFNRRQKDDRALAAAIAKYCAKLESINEMRLIHLIDTRDGRQISLKELTEKMRERIEEIHIEHTNCFPKYKDLVKRVMTVSGEEIFDADALLMATEELCLSFHKGESKDGIRTCELEGFLRYYPHLGGLFYRYFNRKTIRGIDSVNPTKTDGVDYMVTLHLGINSPRILVSCDSGMHINPLRGIFHAYNVFINRFTNNSLLMRDIPLVLSLKDLDQLNLSRPLH